MFTLHNTIYTSKFRATCILLLICVGLYIPSACAQTVHFDSVAKSFLNTPYVANALDRNNAEQLYISLNEVDCTTFVEYVLAAMVSHEKPDSLNPKYCDAVQQVRYRNGQINDYTSRLHYFSEWIANNEEVKLIREITAELNGKPLSKTINFMSTHPKSYAALQRDTTLIDSIRIVEEHLSATPTHYIPKAEVAAIYPQLKTGDIIAITTAIKGLDISHVGFVWKKNEEAYLMHASTTAKRVIIDPLPLAEYLKNNKNATGIRVLRIR